jgi:hypothetical protein
MMQTIDVRKAIEAGLADSAAGRTVPVDEVRRRFGLSEQSDIECRATEAAAAEAPNVPAANATTANRDPGVEEAG